MSKEDSIVEGRKLIYIFTHTDSIEDVSGFQDWWFKEVCPQYDEDWNHFHKAWDKFRNMVLKEWDDPGATSWNHRYSFYLCRIGSAITHSTITDAFQKLAEAIQWYNQLKTK